MVKCEISWFNSSFSTPFGLIMRASMSSKSTLSSEVTTAPQIVSIGSVGFEPKRCKL